MNPETDNVTATDEAAAAVVVETKTAEEIAAGESTEGATGTEAEPAEGSEEADAAKASAAGKALSERKRSAQERINQAVRGQREAERVAARATAEAATLRAKLKKPDPATFEDVTELNAAQFEHSLDVREANRKSVEATNASEDAEKALRRVWSGRVAAFQETVPDFKQVATIDAPISDATARDIMRMEEGPQIAYHLGKTAEGRELAVALNEMTERERAIALGRLAGKMSAQPLPRRTTKAPPPIEDAVNGKGAGGSLKFAQLSTDEYAKVVAKEMGGRLR